MCSEWAFDLASAERTARAGRRDHPNPAHRFDFCPRSAQIGPRPPESARIAETYGTAKKTNCPCKCQCFPARTDLSTSWGSLVRAQHGPLKKRPAQVRISRVALTYRRGPGALMANKWQRAGTDRAGAEPRGRVTLSPNGALVGAAVVGVLAGQSSRVLKTPRSTGRSRRDGSPEGKDRVVAHGRRQPPPRSSSGPQELVPTKAAAPEANTTPDERQKVVSVTLIRHPASKRRPGAPTGPRRFDQ